MRRLLVPLFLVAVSSAAALLAFELALRALGFSSPAWYQPDRQLGWTLRPGVSGWFTKEGKAFVQINSTGQRDREHTIDKPENVYRIAVLGDSYSEAMQVALDTTYWAQLPELLQSCGFQPGKDIEVLNFGVSGYGTAQEYLMLETTAVRYQPDLVLLQFTNGNDVRNNSFALEPEKERPFFGLDANGLPTLDDSFASTPDYLRRASPGHEMLRKLIDRSRLAQLLRGVRDLPLMARAHAQGDAVEAGLDGTMLAPPRDAIWEEAWHTTELLMAKIRDFALHHGAKLVIVTVPYAIQAHPEVGLRESLQGKLGVVDLFYPDRRVASFARQNGFLAVVLAPEMQALGASSGAYLYGFQSSKPGFGHWNERGHRAAAEIIAQRLCGRPF